MALARQRSRTFIARAIDLFPLTALGLARRLRVRALRYFAYERARSCVAVTGYAALVFCALAPLVRVADALWLRLRTRRGTATEPLLLETGSASRLAFVCLGSASSLVQLRWSWLVPHGVTLELRREGQRLVEWGERDRPRHHEAVERRLLVHGPCLGSHASRFAAVSRAAFASCLGSVGSGA